MKHKLTIVRGAPSKSHPRNTKHADAAAIAFAEKALERAEISAALAKRALAINERLLAICEQQEERLNEADLILTEIVTFLDAMQRDFRQLEDFRTIIQKSQDFLALRRQQQSKARRDRPGRHATLKGRVMQAVVRDSYGITANQVLDRLHGGESWIFELENLELSRAGRNLVVCDLTTGEQVTIKQDNLRKSLKVARDRVAGQKIQKRSNT